jgi:hypothetical protein
VPELECIELPDIVAATDAQKICANAGHQQLNANVTQSHRSTTPTLLGFWNFGNDYSIMPSTSSSNY